MGSVAILVILAVLLFHRRQVLGRAGDGRSVIILFFLPWLDCSPVKSIRYRPASTRRS
jgi:ubiquinol-cytochrome c reductase cytochrome b subunit